MDADVSSPSDRAFDLTMDLITALRDGYGVTHAACRLRTLLGGDRVALLSAHGDSDLPGTFSLACALIEECGAFCARADLDSLGIRGIGDALNSEEFTEWLLGHSQIHAILQDELAGVGAVEGGGVCPATPSDDWDRARLASVAFCRGAFLELGRRMESEVLSGLERHVPVRRTPGSFDSVINHIATMLEEDHDELPELPDQGDMTAGRPAWSHNMIVFCAQLAVRRRYIKATIRKWMETRLSRSSDRIIFTPESVIASSWVMQHSLLVQHELLSVVLAAYPRDEQVWERMRFYSTNRRHFC